MHKRPALDVREGHGFNKGSSGAGVPHTQTHFADTANSDVRQRRHVAVAMLPLVLQDDIAGAAVARQRNLRMGQQQRKVVLFKRAKMHLQACGSEQSFKTSNQSGQLSFYTFSFKHMKQSHMCLILVSQELRKNDVDLTNNKMKSVSEIKQAYCLAGEPY